MVFLYCFFCCVVVVDFFCDEDGVERFGFGIGVYGVYVCDEVVECCVCVFGDDDVFGGIGRCCGGYGGVVDCV